MGLALHNFNDNSDRLPAALIHSGRYNNANNRPYEGPEVSYKGQPYQIYNHTGFVALLPYIEQDNLFRQYNYQFLVSSSNPYGIPLGNDPNPNPNRIVAQTPVKIYMCPSDNLPAQVTDAPRTTGHYERDGTQRSNYTFATGVRHDSDLDWGSDSDIRKGAFGNNGAAKLAAIPDGTSNTIAIGEAVGGVRKTSASFGPYWGAGTHTAVHGRVASGPSSTVLDQTQAMASNYPAFHINAPYYAPGGTPDALRRTYAWVFGSNHSGGANFLMLDGSVRFLRDSMDYTAFCALNYFADGTNFANLN
jgi:prepilin-type processing-associated H-X9-DG protein